jgi:hypothetical protein
MLRLRPSELTLTPEDVEETFRRIAHRQALKAGRHVSSQSSTLAGRPILRQSAQRAVRDAITTLGDIPILRPQPQQALHSSVDGDIDDSDQVMQVLCRLLEVVNRHQFQQMHPDLHRHAPCIFRLDLNEADPPCLSKPNIMLEREICPLHNLHNNRQTVQVTSKGLMRRARTHLGCVEVEILTRKQSAPLVGIRDLIYIPHIKSLQKTHLKKERMTGLPETLAQMTLRQST